MLSRVVNFEGKTDPFGASLVAQVVKNPPAMQETQVRSMGREDPLEKGMATHSSILARIPLTEEPGGLQSMGLKSRINQCRLFIHSSVNGHSGCFMPWLWYDRYCCYKQRVQITNHC